MLQLSILMYRRYPGYEVKVTIALSQRNETTQDEYQEQLGSLRYKLEQVIPGNYKVKYNISRDDMVLKIPVDKASEAQRVIHKMEQYVKDAAATLKLN